MNKVPCSWSCIQHITQVNINETHITLWFYDQVDTHLPDPTLRRRGQVELSMFQASLPGHRISAHLWPREWHTWVPRARVFWSPPGTPLAAAPPPVTDTEKGPIQSYSMPGSQTQMPSEQNIVIGFVLHRWCLVLEGELCNESVGSKEHRPP